MLFIGDLIIPGAVPFLANSDLTQWVETLDLLLKPEYRQYLLVSGRNGVINNNDIRAQIKLLGKINKQVEKFTNQPLRNEDIQKAANHILKDAGVPKATEIHHLQRARYGLTQYLRRTAGAQPEQPSVF